MKNKNTPRKTVPESCMNIILGAFFTSSTTAEWLLVQVAYSRAMTMRQVLTMVYFVFELKKNIKK